MDTVSSLSFALKSAIIYMLIVVLILCVICCVVSSELARGSGMDKPYTTLLFRNYLFNRECTFCTFQYNLL